MFKNNMKKIAEETISVVKQGSYKVSNKVVELEKVQKGILYTPIELEGLKGKIDGFKTYSETSIHLINESTVDTIFKEFQGEDVGVLNFASAKHPGGGFLNGAMAQEEALAYCSNLYDTILGNEYYELNSKVKTMMYTDNMIIGPVTFFRNSDYAFVETPKTVEVLTSAAVNMGQVKLKGEDEEKAKKVMKERMRKVLYLFAKEGCSIIILGAFGCGVFGNNPRDIANYWVDLLREEGLERYFKGVYFTIYDKPFTKGNFAVFEEVLKERCIIYNKI